MFRKMRRSAQQLSAEQSTEILNKCTSGILSLAGDNGYPYGVPLSYAFNDGTIYFHSAVEGHKIDGIKRNDKCSFCVIAQDDILPEKFTTLYKSVICFGKINLVEDETEKRNALLILAEKYSPDIDETLCQKEINTYIRNTCILALDIEHMTGKQCREFLNR